MEMWQDVIDKIANQALNCGQITHFQTIKDNAERVNFALQSQAFKFEIISWAKSCLNSERNALLLKEQGNQLFGSCQYPESIAYYTACTKAAEKNCKEYALALANRSAALFHIERYEECLHDIESALSGNYPEALKPKVLLRKYRALTRLNNDHKRTTELLESLKTSLPSELKKAEQEAKMSNPQNRTFESERTIPGLLLGAHPSILDASKALDIKYTPEKGRYVITRAPVSIGDTLFVEKPYALVLLPDYRFLHCHHCVKKLRTYIPCLNCGEAWFCSSDCANAAKVYHQYECDLHRILAAIGIAHLGLRVVLTAGLSRVLDFHRQKSKLLSAGTESDIYGHLGDSYSAVYRLVTHMEDADPTELYLYTLTAALVTHLLQDYTDFIGPNVDSSVVGGYLLHHIRQLVCNAHAITSIESKNEHKSESAVSLVTQERIATAIYPSASLMNHSCDPSIISGFIGNMLVVKAVKNLSINDEVFNCYGPHFRRMSRAERQEALRGQYCFTCKCSACTDPEDFQEKLMSFRCLACGGCLMNPQSKEPKASNVQLVKCRDCHTQQPYMAQLRADLEAMAMFKQAEESLDLGDVKAALKNFSASYRLRKDSLNPMHPDLAQTSDMLAHSYALVEDYERSAQYLRLSLPSVEHRYGMFSIEVAHEYQKFTDVLLQLIPNKKSEELTQEARKYLERALQIFEMHYGTWHEDYQEIASKLQTVS